MNKFVIPIGIVVIVAGVFMISRYNMEKTTLPNSNKSDYNITVPIVNSDYVLDDEIPSNYVPVPGKKNVFMIVDLDGKVLKYQKREQQADGTWLFFDLNTDIPSDYIAVDGLANVYKTTKNGVTKYYRYIRNEDNSFAFVEVDEHGNEVFNTDATTIASNYIWVTGNIYAVYDENNVVVMYVERYKENNSYKWRKVDRPNTTGSGVDITSNKTEGSTSSSTDKKEQNNNNGGSSNNNSSSVVKPDGTLVKTSSYTESKVEENYLVTYKTTITYTYDSSGNLLSTKKDGPTEISRTTTTANNSSIDKSKIKSTLGDEWYRVCGSVSFNTSLSSEILTMLNLERMSNGIPALNMDVNSDLYKLAQIKCADMVIYQHSTSNSPMYGTVNQMFNLFGLGFSGEESVIKTVSGSASDNHLKLQNIEQIQKKRMSSSVSQVAIVVITVNGMDYIYEAYI